MIATYIGLGSNLGDSRQHLQQALAALGALAQCQLVNQSPFYRSQAVGPGEQPDYVNAVARLDTQLAPLQLLDQLQAIENAHGRERLERWGARTLDLDLLLYGDQTIACERLNVPHPYLTERNFVLYPLADLSPTLVLPNGRSLASLLADCPSTGLLKDADTQRP